MSTLPNSGNIPPAGGPSRSAREITLERELRTLKDLVLQEAVQAVGMLEQATDALMRSDVVQARLVIGQDDEIDREEVHIEEECFRILALFQPFARDFREVTTLMKVNSDLERVADHSCALAKQAIKLKSLGVTELPVSLQELCQRVPMLCHALLRVLRNEEVTGAREVLQNDRAIDSLDKRLFDECLDLMEEGGREGKAAALRIFRCGRELERVGDLMKNIAEDLIYLETGSIVRHEKNPYPGEGSKA
jgi:phosphate transport system protein